MPGDEATFINPFITLPPPLGGLGLAQIGGYDEVRNRFFYAATPLGEQIELNEPLFLQNVMLPQGGAADMRIRLIDAGNLRAQFDLRLVPEPAACGLALIAVCGLLAKRKL